MYKESTKYKLSGYQPVGISYNIPREEIAEWKNGHWYPVGSNKRIVNFIIETITEIK
jgi:hypothetical protein